jgi:hypothetical protein
MLSARVAVLAMAIVFGACAHFQNTPAQILALERWEMCKSSGSDVRLREVRQDGQISFSYGGPSNRKAVLDCLQEAAVEQAKARRASTQAAVVAVPLPATQSGSAAAVASIAVFPIPVPVWSVGDEWVYRYDQPNRSGTFVWSVDRIESLHGEPHYVIKSGTRQIFYRVSDVAFTEERVDNEVVRSLSPSEARLAFPLTTGKSWDLVYEETRPVERQTESIQRSCEAQAQEAIAVPAGTFSAMRIVCKNKRNGAWVMTLWFADEIRQYVRAEWTMTGGRHTRELLSYRLR